MNHFKVFSIGLILLFSIPMLASAQSKTEKLYLNVHLNANRITPEDGDGSGGGGLGIKAGYGFSRLFTLYLGIEGAEMNAGDFAGDNTDETEEFGLGFAELGAQFNFRTGKPAAIPYAEIALSGQAAVFDPDQGDDITFTGGGLTLGGGLKYFVSKTLALDLGLLFTFGTFSEVESGDVTIDFDDVNTTSPRLNFGLSWFPFNK